MHGKTIRMAALAIAAMAAAFGATTASARQCVANKGAYIINVKWFPGDAIHIDDKGELVASKPMTEEKGSIPIGQSSCNETGEQLTAVVAVEGCLAYLPANGQGSVNCTLVNTRGPVEVLPDTVPACATGCMRKPHLASKIKDDTALGRGYGFPPSVIVVGTIPAGKSLELTGTTGRVAYGIK
jgi:hypothetical protein